MVQRKGLGKGQGMGYKNITGVDSNIHSESAKGVKQPQKISIFTRLGNSAKTTGDRVSKLIEQKKLEAENKRKETRLMEQRELETPEFKKLKSQEKRVNELRFQIENTNDEDSKEELQEELTSEEYQLNERIESISDVRLEDYSDTELKNLAVRIQEDDGFFSGFFGDSENIYEKEILRRTRKRKELNERIKQENKKPIEKKDDGFFDGLF